MTREEASIIVGNIPINGDECYSIPEYQQAKAIAIKALEQQPCEMTVEEYRQRMIDAFHNANCDELIAVVVRPEESEFKQLEWLLKNHYHKQKQQPCEDAISRQAVLDALDSHKYSKEFCEEHHIDWSINLDMTHIAINDLPSVTPKEKTGWIPVSERLPEEEKQLYWVCTDTGYQCQCRWTNDVYGLGASDRWGWKIFDTPQYQKVIAWMPLPEPYRAESEDK